MRNHGIEAIKVEKQVDQERQNSLVAGLAR
jgi:hypothetical protein